MPRPVSRALRSLFRNAFANRTASSKVVCSSMADYHRGAGRLQPSAKRTLLRKFIFCGDAVLEGIPRKTRHVGVENGPTALR